MRNVISFYLDKERIYYTQVSVGSNGLILEQIGATSEPIIFDDFGKIIHINIQELNELFLSQFKNFSKVEIIYPADYSLISSIPYSEDITPPDLAEMLELETSRAFPGSDPDNFEYDLYMIKNSKIITVITPNEFCNQMNNIFSAFNIKPINKFNNHIWSLNSFINAYSELKQNTTMLVGLQNNTASINIISNNQLIFTKDVQYSSRLGIASVLEREVKAISREISGTSGFQVYLYGSELTKETMDELHAALGPNYPTERLNPFRNMTHKLDQRGTEYVSRTMHYFPACIGALQENHLG